MGWFSHQLTQPNLTNQLVAPNPGAKLPGPDGSRDMRRELEEWQRRRQNPTVVRGEGEVAKDEGSWKGIFHGVHPRTLTLAMENRHF